MFITFCLAQKKTPAALPIGSRDKRLIFVNLLA